MEKMLPTIPDKRYFTIGEVSELCGVKPYVLRYWEQEFAQLKPMKRRGNRRYYQHHEVLLIRQIRTLLYEQGFTISGARNRLGDPLGHASQSAGELTSAADESLQAPTNDQPTAEPVATVALNKGGSSVAAIPALNIRCEPLTPAQLREELGSICKLLNSDFSKF